LTQTLRPIRYVIFTGPSKSGKSTAAALLVSVFRDRSRSAMHSSFEAPMKRYLATLFGRKSFTFKMDEQLSELLSKTPRDFLNLEAMHMRFHFGPGVMGKLLLARVKLWTHAPRYIVVDDGASVLDCRALGRYFLVQIVRDRVERVYPFVIPNADVRVRNDGTIEQLRKKMESIADMVEKENMR
jgi:energy-coupling factor transporter ATP-binding protein EcfA2